MTENLTAKKSKINRIGGYILRIVSIADSSGKILSYVLKPHQVEFRLQDVLSDTVKWRIN